MGQIVGKNGRPGKIGGLRAGGLKKGCFGVFWDPGNGPKYGILSLKQGYFRGQNKAYFGAILGGLAGWGSKLGLFWGSFWGLFWACLYRKNGGFWPILGSFWARLGVEMGSNLGLFWGHFGAYFGPVCIGKMGVFGLFWGHFGPILGVFWGPVSQSWATLDAKNGVFLGVSKWQHGFFRTPKRVKKWPMGRYGHKKGVFLEYMQSM